MNSKLKIAALCLATVLAIGFAVYRILNIDDGYTINDPDCLSAFKWLQLADREDFEECRAKAENPEQWLEVFKANRKSLESLKSRRLRSKSIARNGALKITFKSVFGKAPKIDEIVWVGKDGKVSMVKYEYSRMPSIWRSKDTGKPEEIQDVKRIASQAVSAMRTLDMNFFNQIPNGKTTVRRLKQIGEKFGYPYKYNISPQFRFGRNMPGITEIETAAALIVCSYKAKNKNYRSVAVLILNKDKSVAQPQWEIQNFYIGRVREQKPRRTAQAGKNAKPK
jgi:hypothetical protein